MHESMLQPSSVSPPLGNYFTLLEICITCDRTVAWSRFSTFTNTGMGKYSAVRVEKANLSKKKQNISLEYNCLCTLSIYE